jgi:peptidoglycan/LPS O-acetylase OafA/YrhL
MSVATHDVDSQRRNGSVPWPDPSKAASAFANVRAPHRYIPGFDGLRAIAALSVIGFHLGLPGLSLGWAGVHLFFVLSGFLITGILLETKKQGGYFRTFYWRRAFRIFPIYFLMLAVLGILAVALSLPTADWAWYALYLQNWRLAQTSPSFPSWFDHTWSLACEEQFYLIWPAVVYTLNAKTLFKVTLSLIVLGAASRAVVVIHGGFNSWAGFAPLPCIADTIAWGALAQLVVRRYGNAPFMTTLARVSLGLLVALLLAMAVHRGFDAFWTPSQYMRDLWGGVVFVGLLGPIGASLLLVVHSGPALSAVLEYSPLRYIGRISYGLYLYHWPILLVATGQVVSRWHLPVPITYLAVPALTIFVAICSYELIERPFLRMKNLLR